MEKEEEKNVTCHSCGEVVPGYHNYCPKCGARLIVKRPILLMFASGLYLLNVMLLMAFQLYLITVGMFNLASAIGLFGLRRVAGYWALIVSLISSFFSIVVFVSYGNFAFLVLFLTHLLPAILVIKEWDSLA